MSVRDWPVTRKLTAMLLGVSAVALLLTSAAFVTFEVVTFRAAKLKEIATQGRIIATNSTAALAFSNPADAAENLAALKADPHTVAAALYDRDGRLFATYPAGLARDSFPATPGANGYRFAGGRLVGFEPVVQAGTLRLGTLYLADDLQEVSDALHVSGVTAVLVMAVALLLAWLLARMLQGQISGPVLALAEAARAITARSDYSVRAPALGVDEFGRLTSAFNQMLDHIEKQERAVRAAKEELERYAGELEARVRERTRELEERNEVLRHSEAELLAANGELDAFAYSVSHDLRAPLRSIDGFSQVLLEDYGAKLDEAGKDSLQRVRAATQRMGSLIDDLLRLARVTQAELKPERVDLSATARDVLDGLQRAAPDRVVDLAVADGLEARGDPRLVRVALENLIGNSWKYSGKSAQPRIEFGAEELNGQRVFYVRDNGAGFDMKYADKLFGVFQRLHSPQEFEGTGIGLATVRRIINRHGGRIWAEGAIGQGAKFSFTL